MGGNVGDVKGSLKYACTALLESGAKILKKSALYQTEAWGLKDQDAYINQGIIVETTLLPSILLDLLLTIEQKCGRVRSHKNAARTLDLDILYFDDWVVNHPYLQIPHPRLADRNFCLVILQDLMPDFCDPIHGKGIQELLKDCGDDCKVELLLA